MKRNNLCLVALAFVVALLPVAVLRDFTPSNELRYLSIADEALRDGHLFTFTNQGEPYADKPPLYLWLVMLGKLLFGEHRMGFLALFSLLPAVGILFTMDGWVRPVLERRGRVTAAAMLLTSGLFLGLAVFLRMDMLMCLFITLALRIFWRLHSGEGRPADRFLFPLCVFLALFTKGPVGLLVPLLATVVFLLLRRQARSIGRYWGWRTWAILGALCALWFGAVWLEGGAAYLNNLLFHQTLDRAVDAFHHKEPFWYYLVTMWYSLAPWSLLIVGLLVAALVRRMKPTELEGFFLTVILSTMAMLSLFSSKIAVYLAPTFPFFVYVAVLLMVRMRTTRWMKAAVALPAAVWVAVPVAAVVMRRTPQVAQLCDGWCWAAAGVLLLSGAAALVLLWRRQTLHAPIRVLAGGLLLTAAVGGFALPKLNVELGYGDLCREAQRTAEASGAQHYYTWRMHRPEAMDVYLGEDVVQVTGDELLAGACPDGVLMLPARRLADDEGVRRLVDSLPYRAVGGYLLVELPRVTEP